MRHFIGDFQAHDFTTHASLAQTLFDGNHQIVCFQVPQFQVGVPGDSEEVMPLDAHAWEQQTQVEGHDLFQRHGGVNRSVLGSGQIRWDGDESRKDRLRHFHSGQQALSGFRISNQRRHIQAQVADEGEWVCWIHRQGCEHRKDRRLEVVVDPESLTLIELRIVEQMRTVVMQLLLQSCAVVLLLTTKQRCEVFTNGLQLFDRCESVFAAFVDPCFNLSLQ